MADTQNDIQKHPANAVFLLLDDRKFRHSVIKTALDRDKQGICRLATGKTQLPGFRNFAKAPVQLLVPVISDDVSVGDELAHRVLIHWFEANVDLEGKVRAKLQELGYEPQAAPFDEEKQVSWQPLSPEHADLQYEGEFLPDENADSAMLMSLLLGWFGADEEEADEQPEENPEPENKKAPAKKTAAAKKDEKPAEEKEAKKPAKKPAAKKSASSSAKSGAKKAAPKSTGKSGSATAKSKSTSNKTSGTKRGSSRSGGKSK